MNRETRKLRIDGPAGLIEAESDEPAQGCRGVAVLCHPHPLHGGTMGNKVVQTLARAFVQMGYRAVRFNFRGGPEHVVMLQRGEREPALAPRRVVTQLVGDERVRELVDRERQNHRHEVQDDASDQVR